MLNYREVNEDDFPLLENLIGRCLDEVCQKFYDDKQVELLTLDKVYGEAFQEINESRHQYVLYPNDDKKDIQAYVTFYRNSIWHLYVSPDHIGEGLGKKLLSFAEEGIMDLGYHFAKVNSSLNAKEFYKSQGYVEYEGKEAKSTIHMFKHLTKSK